MSDAGNSRKAPTKRKPTQRHAAQGPARSGREAAGKLTERLERAARQTREQQRESSVPTENLQVPDAEPASRRYGSARSAADGARTPASRAASRHSSDQPQNRAAASRSSSARQDRATRRLPSDRVEKPPVKKSRIVVFVLIVAIMLVACISLAATYCQADNNKIRACEQWRDTVTKACLDTKLDEHWADAVLALMAVESGGNTEVESVEGVSGDIMQAAEGAYGDIVKDGSEAFGVEAQTPQASIYAGVLEFKQNLDLWKKYLNGIGVGEVDEIQLVVQGYNFGADGWYNWCKDQGITKYTVEQAQEYSETQMPEGAKGTPTHAEKWLSFYEKLRG